MARRLRSTPGGVLYHVLNRAAKRTLLFANEQDYCAFEHLIVETKQKFPIKIFAYILMPNHWHFLLCPQSDRELSRVMHWMTTTHSRRWVVAHDKCGTGAVYQSRFKASPIQDSVHAFRICRYIERNALRANLVGRAEQWRWSSLRTRVEGGGGSLLDPPPFALPADWVELVNLPQTDAEVAAIRQAAARGTIYGEADATGAVKKPGRPPKVLRRIDYEIGTNGV